MNSTQYESVNVDIRQSPVSTTRISDPIDDELIATGLSRFELIIRSLQTTLTLIFLIAVVSAYSKAEDFMPSAAFFILASLTTVSFHYISHSF
jgi:hypothetical protein